MKRTKQSQKKTKFLFVLIILTAILSITATYAWFSSQRDVEITGMKLNVEVAENMQISLDGETWGQSIAIVDMKQFYGTYSGSGDDVKVYQADENDNLNYVPKELLPVSTVGTTAEGRLQFVTGEVTMDATGKSKIESVVACSETDIVSGADIGSKEDNNGKHPYLVFDMYLRNVSAQSSDKLQLNAGSRVWVSASTNPSVTGGATQTVEGVGKEDTGLEYSARVAFIPYKNTTDITSTGASVRGLTATGGEQVAIWEPNALDHTQALVNSNSRGITAISQEVTTYGIKFGAAGSAISDVDSTTDTTNMSEQVTFKPDYTENGVSAATTITDINGNDIELKPNQITKVRTYIWLEGQDPDCVNLASTGDRLQVMIRLTKPQGTGSGGVSYQ